MLDGQQILAAAQSGNAAPTWNVLTAKKSFFIYNFVSYLILIIAGFGLIAYLLLSPNIAIVPKFTPDGLDDAALAMWRTIDMIVFPLAILGFAWAGLRVLLEMQHRNEQRLVLMPEGVVMHKGTETKLITFAQVRNAKITRTSMTVCILTTTLQNGQKTLFRIDTRFGNPRKLLKRILEAYKQYKASNGIA